MRPPINHRGAPPTPVQRDAMRRLATTRPVPVSIVREPEPLPWWKRVTLRLFRSFRGEP